MPTLSQSTPNLVAMILIGGGGLAAVFVLPRQCAPEYQWWVVGALVSGTVNAVTAEFFATRFFGKCVGLGLLMLAMISPFYEPMFGTAYLFAFLSWTTFLQGLAGIFLKQPSRGQ